MGVNMYMNYPGVASSHLVLGGDGNQEVLYDGPVLDLAFRGYMDEVRSSDSGRL